MLIVSIQTDKYGARSGQITDATDIRVPPTHIVVPPYLEEEAWSYLPYLDITIEDGKVVAVAQGEIPELEIDPTIRIAELKSNLSSTDYLAIKYAEGLLLETEYAPIKAQRQAWRDEINELEAQLN